MPIIFIYTDNTCALDNPFIFVILIPNYSFWAGGKGNRQVAWLPD